MDADRKHLASLATGPEGVDELRSSASAALEALAAGQSDLFEILKREIEDHRFSYAPG